MPAKALSFVDYLDRAILPIRILLGGLFIYTSLYHSLHAAEFLQSIKDYQLISGALVPWSGFLFIALEAGVGVLLLFGYFVRQAAVAAAALLLVFTVAIVSAIARDLGIACGCGLGDTQVGWLDVVRDLLLIVVAALIAWRADKEYPWFSAAKAEPASS
jgi:uncharacterized membrane protein YphA (DoxX/SURF4 family)